MNDEEKIRNVVARVENGTVHVPTSSGLVDVLTSTEIIELSPLDAWQSGMGRLLALALHYPYHQKRIHLFGQGALLPALMTLNHYGVRVTTEPREHPTVEDAERQFLSDIASGKVVGVGWDFDGRRIDFAFFLKLYYTWLVDNELGEHSVDEKRLKKQLVKVLGKPRFGRYLVNYIRMSGY